MPHYPLGKLPFGRRTNKNCVTCQESFKIPSWGLTILILLSSDLITINITIEKTTNELILNKFGSNFFFSFCWLRFHILIFLSSEHSLKKPMNESAYDVTSILCAIYVFIMAKHHSQRATLWWEKKL